MKKNTSPSSRRRSQSSRPTYPTSSAQPRHMRTTAVRRDGHQPRVISSNVNSHNTIYARDEGLRPVRDAGLSLMSRGDRRRVVTEKRVARGWGFLILLFAVVVISGLSWMYSSNATGRDLAQKEAKLNPGDGSKAAYMNRDMSDIPVIQASNEKFSAKQLRNNPSDENLLRRAATLGISSVTPTPQFGTFADIKLNLPVGLDDLTEIGFHRAAYTYAQVINTSLGIVDNAKVKKMGGTERDKSLQKIGVGELLMGSTFEMPRSRNTQRRTAVDVGAAAGSLVVSPVSGEVTKVCLYNYDGRVDDYEIHIQPNSHSNLEIVLIHIENPVVKVGDIVEAGVTPMAMVRKMSQYIKNQLADYSGTSGNHVHIQINKIDDPAYIKRHQNDKKTSIASDGGS